MSEAIASPAGVASFTGPRMGPAVDVLYIGDLTRRAEAVERAVEETLLNARIGLSTGLLHLSSRNDDAAVVEPVLQLVETGAALSCDADWRVVAQLIVLLDPELLLNRRPDTPLKPIADRVLAVADRPIDDERLAFKRTRLRELFGDAVIWTATRYDVLAALRAAGVPTTGGIWESFAGCPANPDRYGPAMRGRPVVGAVIPGGEGQWPRDEAVAALWDTQRHTVRFLGPTPPAPLAGQAELVAPGERSHARFVAGLHAFVYFPEAVPSELPLTAIGTCLANDIPVLLPPALRHVVGKGPVYVAPERAAATLRETLAARRNDSSAGFDPAGAPPADGRLGRRPGRPAPAPRAPSHARDAVSRPAGSGWATSPRLLALARRLPAVEPVFVSLSQAVGLIEAAGFPCG
ncbi:MAG: hypothetical protein R3F55_22910 [Alphaproteobacteria bacterium]